MTDSQGTVTVHEGTDLLVIVPSVPTSIAVYGPTQEVKAIVIKSQPHYDEASSVLRQLTDFFATAATYEAGLKQELAETKPYKALEELKIKISLAKQLRQLLAAPILEWDKEQERIRLQQEREAQEEADRETERLAKLAAKETEKQAKKDGLGIRATAKLVEEAKHEVISSAPLVTVGRTYERAAGQHTSKRWHAEVEGFSHDAQGHALKKPQHRRNVLLIARAVAAGKIPVEALNPNMPFLNSTVTATNGRIAWPGVKPRTTESLTQKRA